MAAGQQSLLIDLGTATLVFFLNPVKPRVILPTFAEVKSSEYFSLYGAVGGIVGSGGKTWGVGEEKVGEGENLMCLSVNVRVPDYVIILKGNINFQNFLSSSLSLSSLP